MLLLNQKTFASAIGLVALFALLSSRPAQLPTATVAPAQPPGLPKSALRAPTQQPPPEESDAEIRAPNSGKTEVVRGEGKDVTLPDSTRIEDIVAIGAKGDLLLREGGGYQIVYLKSYNRFLLWISGKPFDAVRARAEEDFLQTVSGSSERDACARDVRVVPAQFVYPGRQWETLSFCQ